jgi:hypothetical protein
LASNKALGSLVTRVAWVLGEEIPLLDSTSVGLTIFEISLFKFAKGVAGFNVRMRGWGCSCQLSEQREENGQNPKRGLHFGC